VNVAAPHLGAWIAHALGRETRPFPPISTSEKNLRRQRRGRGAEGVSDRRRARQRVRPFRCQTPRRRSDRSPPAGMTDRGSEPSRRLRSSSAAIDRDAGSDYQKESLLRSLENADRLLNSEASPGVRPLPRTEGGFDAYNTGKFGQGCLLARRLVERAPVISS